MDVQLISLILSVSKNTSLITTILINYMEKFNFKKKSFFHGFHERWRGGIWDIFVVLIELYHNLKVQDNWIFLHQDIDLKTKIPKDHGKMLSLILTVQLIFVLSSNGNCFISNYDFSVIFCPTLWQSTIPMTTLHCKSSTQGFI